MASRTFDNDDTLWGPCVEKKILDILVDEVNKGNQQNGLFPSKVWKLILNEFNQKVGRSFTMKQMKQKFNRLRIKHRVFSELLSQTSFGWDAETNTVTANDFEWETYLARRPEAAQFRRRGCENYKLMGIVFNRSTATGVLHHASTMDPPNSDEEQRLENEYLNVGVHVDLEENSEDEPVTQAMERSTCNGKRTIKINELKPRKKLRSSQMGDALQAWAEASKARMEAQRQRDIGQKVLKHLVQQLHQLTPLLPNVWTY